MDTTLFVVQYLGASHVAQLVRNPSATAGAIGNVCSMPEWGRSPGGGNDNPASILSWKTPWTEEPGELVSMGLQRVAHD